MRTLDSPAATTSSLASRLTADLRVLWRIAMMAYGYWAMGGRVRRALSDATARGETYWLDERAEDRGEEGAR